MTTGEEVKSALEYRRLVQAMMNDPDLTGDVLLLGVGLLHTSQAKREAGQLPRNRFPDVIRYLGWTNVKLRLTMGQDVPRYEIDWEVARLCAGPMIRREGPCGKPTVVRVVDRDPLTGVGRYVGYCSRHGAHQYDHRPRMREWQANDCPQPPHNKGGVLPRYFTTDWDAIYRWANYGADPTPGEGKPPTIPRPVLKLIRGGVA